MVPPLPAASRPSNTTTTRAPACTTQSCSRHNLVWSFRSSFSYSFRFSLRPLSSGPCLDIGLSRGYFFSQDGLSLHGARRRVPDVGRVLGDGAVAGELAGAGHVDDGLAGPGV